MLPVYVDSDMPTLSVGAYFELTGAEARHAVTVRRTQVGEQIDVVNGRGGRATMTVTKVSKNELGGRIDAFVVDPAHTPHITLVQALAKGGRDEQAVETATEYGVDAVIPWQAQRSIVSWNQHDKATKGGLAGKRRRMRQLNSPGDRGYQQLNVFINLLI